MPDLPNPVARLELAVTEVDRVFGVGFAAGHPEVVSAVMLSASLDWAAMTIAAALVTEEEEAPHNGSGILRATTVMRP